MREQRLWKEHAEFMEALVAEGLVVLGGLIGSGGDALLLIDAASEGAVRVRLAADPWTEAGFLQITRVEPWTIPARRAAGMTAARAGRGSMGAAPGVPS
jgi:uncharacterized protein YciI